MWPFNQRLDKMSPEIEYNIVEAALKVLEGVDTKEELLAPWNGKKYTRLELFSRFSMLLPSMRTINDVKRENSRLEIENHMLTQELMKVQNECSLVRESLKNIQEEISRLKCDAMEHNETKVASSKGADLTETDLRGANLTKTDLRGADLRGADLTDADLRGTNLSESNLAGANLSYANLTVADLRGVNLCEANLTDAILSKANLSEAYIIGSDLTRADLSGANLTEAYLSKSNLSEAYLTNADLTGAELCRTNLYMTDLRGAILDNANLDASTFSLSWTSFDFHSDIEIPAQLAYHLTRIKCDDPIVKKAQEAIKPLAKEYHRYLEYERGKE